jgi:hypothetical protein
VKYSLIVAALGIFGGGALTVTFIRHGGEMYHTKGWYLANPADTVAKLDWCRDNPGLVTPNYTNADDAQTEKSFSDFAARANAMPWPAASK